MRNSIVIEVFNYCHNLGNSEMCIRDRPIAYKASPFTLSSEEYGYAETVKYWMPFVYGQGLHDASWQLSLIHI